MTDQHGHTPNAAAPKVIINDAYHKLKNSQDIDWNALRKALIQARKYGCSNSSDAKAVEARTITDKRLGKIATCVDGKFTGEPGRHPDDQKQQRKI